MDIVDSMIVHNDHFQGRNDFGQLGIGHSDNVEKPLNVTIDLGTDFVPREVGCGSFHCCSVSTTDLLKCLVILSLSLSMWLPSHDTTLVAERVNFW